MKTVFITGGTGYIGRRLIDRLLKKKYRVVALVRKGSETKIPVGAKTVIANPFDSTSFVSSIPKDAVFVQLLGVPHPSPKKAKQFNEIDLVSVKASADAAAMASVSKFVYVSVAMSPSKIMEAYQAVRKEGEAYCLSKNLNCTFIRPWYVLGPGHWWPILLLPGYAIAELVPTWRKQARAKALVTINQMLHALVYAIESKNAGNSVMEISDIRKV
jgi:nucleoside-diphosphate-sugar epimerase